LWVNVADFSVTEITPRISISIRSLTASLCGKGTVWANSDLLDAVSANIVKKYKYGRMV
jgi:hypothetical protein